MILANIEGQVVLVVIMAIFGVINWISSKLNPADKNAPPNPLQPSADAASRPANPESEDERMRRFLEALGLPTDERPAPPRPRSGPLPVPPIVAPSPFPSAPRRPVRPVTAQPSPPPPRANPPSLHPPAVAGAETISLPELDVPSAPEFATISSKISAMPVDFPMHRAEADRAAGATISETLRAALASPQQLRSAFVLREIFGTPPGLREP